MLSVKMIIMDLKEKLYSNKNNIFQSKIWADFQKGVGREPVKIEETFFYKENLFRDKDFLFAPKGEAVDIEEINKNARGSIFVRVEPSEKPKARKFKAVTQKSLLSQQYSPKQTLVLDLTKKEEELLQNMKSKHRYNIRLAEKKGVTIKSGYSPEDLDCFYTLSLEVAKRDKTFSPHKRSYYDKMAAILGPKNYLKIFTAFYNDSPISSILVLFYNETAIYLHGASANEYRELMPNHLVQWTAIKEAKKKGCRYYDFWGASFAKTVPEKDSSETNDPIWIVDESHPWAGISKFKLGFVKPGETGEVVDFPGAYDLILSPFWYKILSHGNRVRRFLKNKLFRG